MEENRTFYPKKMNVSVVIPTYNRSDVICRSLESWAKQTVLGAEFEVIVVDNNSTDHSSGLIKDFIKDYPNFHYLKEHKAGSTNARHAGTKRSKSEILIFADDDGLFNPDCIEEILKVYQSNPEIDAVAGKIDIAWDKTAPEWIAPYEFMLGKLNYGTEVMVGTDLYLNGGLFSIKRSVFDELGGFNPDLVGDYLVGDGDTGLVIKLHNEKRLIGWTPFAQMQHLQFVDKQGTEQDMGRRFYNVGISNAYGLFRANRFTLNKAVLKFIFKSLILLIKKFAEYRIRKERKTHFSMMKHKGELDFFIHLRKKEIRKEIIESLTLKGE